MMLTYVFGEHEANKLRKIYEAVAISQMHTILSSTVLRFILYLVSLKLIATDPFNLLLC